MELLRSLLFVPGNRPDMIEKARSLLADALVLDLEDSVPLSEKEKAREVVAQRLPHLALRGQQVWVRVNSLATGLTMAELEAVVGPHIHGISLPKVEGASDIQLVAKEIEALERERGLEVGRLGIIPWVELARAIIRAEEIATASPRVVGLAFGADDFSLDMGMLPTPEGLMYPRAKVAVAARAADILALDSPYIAHTDPEGLVAEATLVRKLGFQGKFVIHPSQIQPVNDVFRPSAEEIEEAREMVSAFAAAQARGSAAIAVRGRLVDTPVARRAERLLRLAEALARREGIS
ncbi:MAG: CoA ester lyase [Chloroflexi bacterium]|nr:CoA ester lyase [Chloroflexota bacterium]